MRTILVGECTSAGKFGLVDPDAPSETELEYSVVRALNCIYPEYHCFVFTGGFRYDEVVYRPDLALVAKDHSHWFVLEVELVSHSLDGHVLPQVRAFQYGSPEQDCVGIIARELELRREHAATLLEAVPRSVAVVANKRDSRWEVALSALQVQLLTLSTFRGKDNMMAVEVDGVLEVVAESLGFGKYSATDRSLRFPRAAKLSPGMMQLDDPTGAPSTWTVSRADDGVWVRKNVGVPDLEPDSWVQIIRTGGGRLSLRRSRL